MSGRIVIFGASGYTGGLIAERLVAQGASPVLAGRDLARLRATAERLGADLEVARADVYRQNAVFDLVGAGDVLVATVGPFAKYGAVAVRAAIATGAVYLDSTGESSFIRRVFEEFDAPARQSGAALLTALGYEFAPGALAGALALRDAGADAVRVDVGYYVLGATRDFGTPGSKESVVGATLDPSFAFRHGAVAPERSGAHVRAFAVAGTQRPAFSIGGAEHYTLPAAHPALTEVNVFLGGLGPLTRGVQAMSAASELAQRVPGTRNVMQFAGEKLAALAPVRVAGGTATSTSVAVAAAYDGAGAQLAEVAVEGPDVYDFTATFMAWAAQRAATAGVDGAGALSPVLAFGGLDAFAGGCAAAGLGILRP